MENLNRFTDIFLLFILVKINSNWTDRESYEWIVLDKIIWEKVDVIIITGKLSEKGSEK